MGGSMASRYAFLLLALAAVTSMASTPAQSQVEPFVGEIRYVAFNFAPQGWAQCNGQLLTISDNEALFSLLGTTYGGDGKTTFALPNMQGRVPIHQGNGAGLSDRIMGEIGGQETVALTTAQMPAHRHQIFASSGTASTKAPSGNVLANSSTAAIYSSAAPDVKLANKTVGVAGQTQPHENMQPFLTVNCIIALQGVYPSRP